MHLIALGRVFALVIVALIQVIAIVDFNFDDDPKSDAQLCCMVEHKFPQEPFRKCYEQHKTPSMDNDTVMCIHQCYYDAIGLFPGGKNIEAANYLKYRDELEPALQKPFTYALLVCGKIAIKLIEHFAASPNKMRCNPIPYLFNRCLMEVDMVNCSKEHWINSTLCEAVVQKLKERYGEGVVMPETTNGKPSDE